jgi:hypothetical protein
MLAAHGCCWLSGGAGGDRRRIVWFALQWIVGSAALIGAGMQPPSSRLRLLATGLWSGRMSGSTSWPSSGRSNQLSAEGESRG